MPKLEPIEQLNRVSDDMKRISWICQNCDAEVAIAKWIDDLPYCAECAEPMKEDR